MSSKYAAKLDAKVLSDLRASKDAAVGLLCDEYVWLRDIVARVEALLVSDGGCRIRAVTAHDIREAISPGHLAKWPVKVRKAKAPKR